MIRSLNLTQVGAAKLLGVDDRTARRWLAGASAIPGPVARFLMLAKGWLDRNEADRARHKKQLEACETGRYRISQDHQDITPQHMGMLRNLIAEMDRLDEHFLSGAFAVQAHLQEQVERE